MALATHKMDGNYLQPQLLKHFIALKMKVHPVQMCELFRKHHSPPHHSFLSMLIEQSTENVKKLSSFGALLALLMAV